jgi:hypothetical protein
MANSNGIVWTGTLVANVRGLEPKLSKVIAGIMLASAPKVANYARTNAPWRDRTGNARQGLAAKYSASGGVHRIDLAHGMPYGIYLEVKNAGQYAIIVPTIIVQGQAIMASIKGAMGKIQGVV